MALESNGRMPQSLPLAFFGWQEQGTVSITASNALLMSGILHYAPQTLPQ